MKTLVAYKENGIANMLVAGSYYYDEVRLPAENNSFYMLGHGIIMGCVGNPLTNLPLKLLQENVNNLLGEVELNKDFMLHYIIPAILDMYKKCELVKEDEGVYSLPESCVFIQGNTIFLLRKSLNFYEVDDFTVVGDFALPLLNALSMDYYNNLGYEERIVELIKSNDKFCREKRTELYHIDTEGMKARRLDI